MTPSTIVLAVSQNWSDLAFLEDRLVEFIGQAPNATFRLPSAAHGGGREARVFLESIGAKVEVWWPEEGWPKNATEIRNAGILRGFTFPFQTVSERDAAGWPPHRIIGPRANLVLVLWKGGSDVAGDILKRALALTYTIVCYKETSKDIKRATTNPKNKLTLTEWRPVLTVPREEAA